mgnify:CR=1 FL=1
MNAGILEIDLHGMNCRQAKTKIDSVLRRAGGGTYTVRLIHGYHGGTRIREMIGEEYGCGRHEKVLRIRPGGNPGITELVLREL